eukprot:scaffold40700_cov252-Amphora_coffeaeformis.AAC.1
MKRGYQCNHLNMVLVLWGLLLLGPAVTEACYVGVFEVSDCGAVGEPTRVTIVFPPDSNATGWANWGEDSAVVRRGFVARNDTDDTVQRTTLIRNENPDNQLFLEHVYTKPGTYSISFGLTVYPNATIDQGGWCISTESPAEGDEWLLTVSETGCRDRIRSGVMDTSLHHVWTNLLVLCTTMVLFMSF